MSHRLALLLLALVALPAAEIDVTVPWIDEDGWTPVIVRVPAGMDGPVQVRASLGTSRTEVVLNTGAGEPIRRTLLVPTPPRAGTAVGVTWQAPGRERGEKQVYGVESRGFDVGFIDPDEQAPLKDLLKVIQTELKESPASPREPSWRRSGSSGYPEDHFRRLAAETLPDRWQGYPLWLTLVVAPAGDRRLDLAQREALVAWSRAGGALFVSDPGQLASWRGLGAEVAVVSAAGLENRLLNLARQAEFSPERLVIPGTGGLPVVGFAVIAVAFALLAGPASYWWAARRGQRALVLLIVPVLSGVTCLLLVVYGLYADGLSTRRVAVQGLLLDQATGQGLAVTGFSLFAGLAPGAFPVDPDERLIPFGHRLFGREGWHREEDHPSVTLDADGRLGGLVPARQVSQFLAVRAVHDRRRLVFSRAGADWQVLNGYDQPLADLTWNPTGWGYWHLDGPALAPGESRLLSHGETPYRAASSALGMEWSLAAWHFNHHTSLPLPGVYRADFAGPLVPVPGPKATDQTPITTRVWGRVAAEATAPAGGAP